MKADGGQLYVANLHGSHRKMRGGSGRGKFPIDLWEGAPPTDFVIVFAVADRWAGVAHRCVQAR